MAADSAAICLSADDGELADKEMAAETAAISDMILERDR
jgi:hypothetical protein